MGETINTNSWGGILSETDLFVSSDNQINSGWFLLDNFTVNIHPEERQRKQEAEPICVCVCVYVRARVCHQTVSLRSLTHTVTAITVTGFIKVAFPVKISAWCN
jgi:hypothetical protein